MRFPESSRVAILQGIIEESKGHLNDAQNLYELMLEKDPSNVLLHKRRIACIKSKPEGIPRATEGLAEFVDIFPTDQESWLELAELYLQQNKYDQAAYALEELLLLAPHNVFYLLKYAEVLYSMGDLAKSYKMYLRILELGDGNLAPNSPRVITACKDRGCARFGDLRWYVHDFYYLLYSARARCSIPPQQCLVTLRRSV